MNTQCDNVALLNISYKYLFVDLGNIVAKLTRDSQQ